MAVLCECLVCLVMIFVTVTNSQIIPQISNVSMTIESNVCEDKTPFLALNVILSHAGEQQYRNDIRETYPAEEIEPLGFRRVFILAEPQNETEQNPKYGSISNDQIIEENERFSDIIQLNFTEHYLRLLYKSYATFKWASENCVQARFIVKTDDDTFVDYYSLAKMLRDIKDDKVDSLFGNVIQRYGFIAGPFYASSPKTLKLLVDTAPTVKANRKFDEDVYFTCDVATVAGVKLVDNPKIRPWGGNPNCCAGNGIVYKCQLIAFTRRNLKSLQLPPLKMNGKTCHNVDCEDFSTELLDMAGVICV